MPFFVLRIAQLLRLRLRGWRLPLAVAVFVFLTSWLAMALLEPAGTGITVPGSTISLPAGSTSDIASQLVTNTNAATARGSRQPRRRSRRNRDRR